MIILLHNKKHISIVDFVLCFYCEFCVTTGITTQYYIWLPKCEERKKGKENTRKFQHSWITDFHTILLSAKS
jgi:hypothetical protein